MTSLRPLFCLAAVAGLSATLAWAQPAGNNKPADKPKPATTQPEKPKAPAAPTGKMPSAEDMQKMQEAYMAAATPGKMHEHLGKGVGTWDGKVKMWHMPGMPVMESTCVTTIAPVFEGRFIKSDTKGEMPGMGHFEGMGLCGYDNAAGRFQMTWIDNMGTAMMTGTGTLSADSKVLTWTMTFTDPVTKKPMAMREVDTYTGPDTMTMEMFGPAPTDGKEFKMMEISYTRKGGAAPMGNKPADKPAEHR